MNLLAALILTILIEFVVYCFFLRKNFTSLFLYSTLINSITNPLMNIALGFGVNVLVLEFIVFVVEIFLIKSLFEIDYKKAVLISFVANLVSLILGLFILGGIL